MWCEYGKASYPERRGEGSLFARIKAGDDEAKEEYIKGNLRLVLSVIKRFHSSNENPDDLFQIGCIGLIKAINNFNTELDVKFSTYAVPMIIGEIRRYMRDNSSIRVSRSFVIPHTKQFMRKKLCETEYARAYSSGNCTGDWNSQGGHCLCARCHSGTYEPPGTSVQ